MSERMIEKLEGIGFKRWTKAGMDRMYVDAKAIGLEVWYSKPGNVSSAEWMGTKVSNSEAKRMLGARTYIDINTGKIHSDNESLANRVADIMTEVGR